MSEYVHFGNITKSPPKVIVTLIHCKVNHAESLAVLKKLVFCTLKAIMLNLNLRISTGMYSIYAALQPKFKLYTPDQSNSKLRIKTKPNQTKLWTL